MRDLQKDLELCEKATLGPWGVCGGGYSVFAVNIPAHKDLGSRVVVAECLTENDGKPFRDAFKIAVEDARFIAQAREGWPHAIERALKAEAEMEKLRAEVERLKLLKLREEVLYDFAPKCLCPWETGCLRPLHDASDCIDCWEKFLEREEAREREKDGGRDSA